MQTEQMRKLDFARLRAAQRDGALAEVKTNILLDRIAAEEEISINDEELDHELQTGRPAIAASHLMHCGRV